MRNLLKRSNSITKKAMMPIFTSTHGGPYFMTADNYHALSTPQHHMQASFAALHPALFNENHDEAIEPARKKRLTSHQTKSLESSFAADSKLEPERKTKLAIELGLEPKQVAIWFQNRRARTKTKHIEDKYSALQLQYLGVLEEKRQLEAEVARLKELLGMQGGIQLSQAQSNQEASRSTNELEEHFSSKSTQGMTCTTNSEILHPNEQVEDKKVIVETPGETEVESEEVSCATAQNEVAFPANSPTTNLNDIDVGNPAINQSTIENIVPFVQPHEYYNLDHTDHHQQDQPQPQARQHYNLTSNHNLLSEVRLDQDPCNTHGYIPTQLVDQLYANYLFELEDETVSLLMDFAP